MLRRERKLTPDQVLEIPKLLRRGLTWVQAAERLGITRSVFGLLMKGKAYPHVQEALQPALAEARAYLKTRPKASHKTCTKCGLRFPRNEKHFSQLPGRGRDCFEGRCRQCKSEANKARHQSYRVEALRHYSEGVPRCACCNERALEFLTFDHIDGGGAKHRRDLKGKAASFGHWLKQNDYPPGFRVLCMNCNFSLGMYGQCPHQTVNNTSNRA